MTLTTTAPAATERRVTELAGLAAIPIELVDPGTNRRGPIGDVTELATSIQALGQLEPATVIAKPGGRYEVFEGHRRHAAVVLLAAQARDGDMAPPAATCLLAVVRAAAPTNHGLKQVAIHTQRRDFDPIAQARVLAEAMFERGQSREAIAAAVGRSAGWVRDRIGLLQLSGPEQALVASGELSVARALDILRHRRNPAPTTGGTMAPKKRARAALTKTGKPKIGENGREGLLRTITEACQVMGLRYAHIADARRQDATGFADLPIYGPGGHMVREVKGDDGRLSDAQVEWLADLRSWGIDADVWTPDDLRSGRIIRELTALRRPRPA